MGFIKGLLWFFFILFLLMIVCGIIALITGAVERSKKEAEEAAQRAANREALRKFADELMAACAEKEKKSWGQMMEEFARGETEFRVGGIKLEYGKVGAYKNNYMFYSNMGVSLTGPGLSGEEKLKCIAGRIAEKIPVETTFETKQGSYKAENPNANTYTTTTTVQNNGSTVHTTVKAADTITRYYLDEIVITAKNRVPEPPKIRSI